MTVFSITHYKWMDNVICFHNITNTVYLEVSWYPPVKRSTSQKVPKSKRLQVKRSSVKRSPVKSSTKILCLEIKANKKPIPL